MKQLRGKTPLQELSMMIKCSPCYARNCQRLTIPRAAIRTPERINGSLEMCRWHAGGVCGEVGGEQKGGLRHRSREPLIGPTHQMTKSVLA